MASYEQNRYCNTCKKYFTKKIDKCPKCSQKLKLGNWIVRFREDIKDKKLSGFKTRQEAIQGFLEYQIKNNNAKSQSDIDFDTLCNLYFDNIKTRIKEGTFNDNKRRIELHISPYFEKYKVNNIKAVNILNWQNNLESDLAFNTKKNIRNLLSSILKFGEKYYSLNNEMYKVEGFRNLDKPKEMMFWTETEFKQFINFENNLTFKAFFSFLYLTGCRKGEAYALSWGDVDFDKNTASINKSITRKIKNKAWAITTLKNTYSLRTIPMPSNLTNLLLQLKETKNNPLLSDFVFGDKEPIPNTTVGRVFINTCKKSNVKIVRIHDLRHSHASLLISKGISIVAVAKRLGHKNIEQTLNTYAHLMPSENDNLLNLLSKISIF